MDRSMGEHFTIPSASMGAFSVLSVMLITPLYDLVFVPLARKLTGHERGITPLQRMSIGFVLGILGTITAAVVENRRVAKVREMHYGSIPVLAFTAGLVPPLPMRVYWLIPQLVLITQIEFFSNVAALELFYNDAPNTMKSLAIALTYR